MVNALSLNGQWKLRWSDGQRHNLRFTNREVVDEKQYIDAEVPGEVHLDLMRHGIIGDVYRDTNVLSARWVEEFLWGYRKEFEATEEMVNAPAIWLYFQQLDLIATIYVNGQEVGKHANVFYPCRVNIAGKLHKGKNYISVHLDAGLYHVTDKPYSGFDNHVNGRLHKRHWLRKPQCSFSWDWSQRLVNVGITGEARLEWTSDPLRVEQVVPLVTMDESLSQGTVRARVFVEGLGEEATKATIRAQVAGVSAEAQVEVKKGLRHHEVVLHVANPDLWWPVGHGKQKLYELAVQVEVGGKTVYAKTCRVGFRHVRINQDKHPATGRYFIIEINHKKIFCKGGNFIPADMIFMRADRARYDKLTDLALESHFNLLRIWGGGMYETDDFYELCDQKGILVWQEFIFACCKYPGIDQEFHENVKSEARYNIRRLARHPSLIVWCGNNEMEQGCWSWGYDKGVVYPDYAIFHLTLPRLMAEEDPTRYYQPSSPFSPDCRDPEDHDTGDQHPWFLGFFDTDFRKYRPISPRFPNEGGCLGPTALPTMLACMPEGQRFPHSFAWEVHDNSIAMWDEPSPTDKMCEQHLGMCVRSMSIEEYTYRGGLVQSEALKEYCESFRRKMFDVSSAIFWMYNDTWPCTRSWTTVDYYLRRTPAFWSVRRSMQPVHVILADEGDAISVYGVNESLEAVSGDLRFGVVNLAGGYPVDEKLTVLLPPNTSTKIASFTKGRWSEPNASFAFAMLMQNGRLIARNRMGLPLMKEMKWKHASVKVELKDGKAIFTSDAFAWGVCIDLSGEIALGDNMFDVYPGIAYEIPWAGNQPPKVLHVGNLTATAAP